MRNTLSEWSDELRRSVRALAHSPVFTASTVLTLAVGLGVGSTTFSLLDVLYARWPARVRTPETIARVWAVEHDRRRGAGAGLYFTYPQILAIAQTAKTATAVYALVSDATVSRAAAPVTARLAYTTASFFPLLGVQPLRGRFFNENEDRLGAAEPMIVLSARFWRTAFGADPGILDVPVRVGNQTYSVVGIAPDHFDGVDLEPVDAWLPIGDYPAESVGGVPWWMARNYAGFQLLMRVDAQKDLLTSVSARATAALRATAIRLGDRDTSVTAELGSLIVARGPGKTNTETQLVARLAVVAGLLLLIVVANVLNLLLTRATERRQEMAVRVALGIGRGRLARLWFVETAVLATLAMIASLAVTSVGGRAMQRLLFPDIEWSAGFLHWHVVLVAAAAAGLIVVLASLVVVQRVGDPGAVLRTGTRGTRADRRLRSMMLIVQTSLSVVLLAGAGWFIRSLRNAEHVPIGYDAQRVVFVQGRPRSDMSDAAFDAIVRDAALRLQQLPGVVTVARTSAEPFQLGAFGIRWFASTDSAMTGRAWRPSVSRITPGYLQAVGLRLLVGRDLQEGTTDVVVNMAMAQRLWPANNALGQCLRLGEPTAPCHRVVGVVEDGIRNRLLEAPAPQFYLAATDSTAGVPEADILTLQVAPAQLSSILIAATRMLQASLPDGRVTARALREALSQAYRPWRVGAWLFAFLGVLAATLAAIGVYAVVAYDITSHRREIGIRVAIGATPWQIIRHVVDSSMAPVLAGAVVGAGIAIAFGRVIEALLYGVTPFDPIVLSTVGLLLCSVAIVATLIPATRAARTSPANVLRAE